jgi:hypothetical protein
VARGLGDGAAGRRLYSRRRGSVHLVAAILYLANPYVVGQANRATASLLAYARAAEDPARGAPRPQ